jgi:UDP-GlcNAc:undecaprenyl-phosphate GlcNAc-1-phosphate transferase
MRLVLAASFGIAFLTCFVLALLMRLVAPRCGLVDMPGGRKTHAGAVPLGGGVAVLLGTCLPVLGAGLLCYLWHRSPGLLPVAAPAGLAADVGKAADRFPLLLMVLAGGLAFAALGLWDDLKDLSPGRKLFGQFLIALVVPWVAPPVRLTLFIPSPCLHVVITAAWIVVMVNSFNLLDNMDGQSGLIAVLTGGAMLVVALETGQSFIAGLLAALLGAVLGFLLLNLPPASLFLGDAGAMFIGYLLAVATTLTTFITGRQVNPLFPVLVPAVIFAVPLYDVLSVVAIRLHKGRPLMEGDRSHIAHRLQRLGMSERTVLVTMGLMVLATSPGATIPYGSSTWRVVVPAVQAVAVILVIVLLEYVGARNAAVEERS